MSRLPILSGNKIIRVLKKFGFEPIRQKGSHVFMKHLDGRATVIPVHKGDDIDRGLLRKILKDAEISSYEFAKML